MFVNVRKLSVYIIECADQSFYVGVTNNLVRRLEEHKQGLSNTAYTLSRRPVALRWSQDYENPNEAIAWEKRIKGWNRAKKEALINGEFEALPELSKNSRNRGG